MHLRTLLNHKAVESLLAYFAADVRRNVRLIILQMLGQISAVAPASVTRSMALVLPPLICTDILAIVAAADEAVIDVEWLMFSALLLTCCLNAEEDGMIYSTTLYYSQVYVHCMQMARHSFRRCRQQLFPTCLRCSSASSNSSKRDVPTRQQRLMVRRSIRRC